MALYLFLFSFPSLLCALVQPFPFVLSLHSVLICLPVRKTARSNLGLFLIMHRKPVLSCGCRWDSKPIRSSAGSCKYSWFDFLSSWLVVCPEKSTLRLSLNKPGLWNFRNTQLLAFTTHSFQHAWCLEAHFPHAFWISELEALAMASHSGFISINPSELGCCIKVCQIWLPIHILWHAAHTH